MKRFLQMVVLPVTLAVLVVVATLGTACANDKKDEAKALVKKAVALIKASGNEKAFAEISSPTGKFVKGELYIFVLDPKGIMLAHGGNPKLIGKNVLEMRDADGNFLTKDHIGVAKKGGGWSKEYRWTNPTSKKVEQKLAYLEPAPGDLAVGCGIYK